MQNRNMICAFVGMLAVGSLGTAQATAAEAPKTMGIRIVPSFGLRISSWSLGSDESGNPVYGTMGQGVHPDVEFYFKLTSAFDLGLETGYWMGSRSIAYGSRNVKQVTNYDYGYAKYVYDYNWNYADYSSDYSANVLPLRVWLRGGMPLGPVRLYAGASIGLYVPGDLTVATKYHINYTRNTTYTPSGGTPTVTPYTQSADYDAKTTYSMSAALGYAAVFGAEFPITPSISLVGQLEWNHVALYPTKAVSHSSTVGTTTTGSNPAQQYSYVYDWTTTYSDAGTNSTACNYNYATTGNTTTYNYSCDTGYRYTDTITSTSSSYTETYSGESQAVGSSPWPFHNVALGIGVVIKI